MATPTATSADTEATPGELLRQEIELVWTDLTRFYGFTFNDLRQMPRVIRRIYYEAMPRIQAEEQQRAIQAASFPNMKENEQRRVQKRLERAARADRVDPKEELSQLTPSQVRERAKSIGIPIRTPGGDEIEVPSDGPRDPREEVKSDA